jgi:hypothetical protein
MLISLVCLAAAAAVESFDGGLDNWWVEGGERVWIEDGRLHVKADNPKAAGGGVATVWFKKPHGPHFRLDVDSHVVSSSINANNINLFFSYSDPSGTPLLESRDSRRHADYGLYHKLNGYIITFLNEPKRGQSGEARIRIRRNPGFNLLMEKFGGECKQGVTYRLTVLKRGGEIVFLVDGAERARATDPKPLGEGLLGLRTFRTHLWWDNLKVEEVAK